MSLKCTMILGDCLEVMPNTPKPSLIVADLPFGASSYAWDVPFDVHKFWRLVDGSPCLAFANCRFLYELIASNKNNFRYELIWDQMRGWTPFLANKMPMRSHQFVSLFSRHSVRYNAQKTTGHSRIVSKQGGSKNLFYNHEKKPGFVYDSSERFPTSVLQFPPDKKTKNNRFGTREYTKTHPSAKPVELLRWLIRAYSQPRDTILDPTSGSASTALAALIESRDAICIEKDPTYFGNGVERVRKTVADNKLNVAIEVRR